MSAAWQAVTMVVVTTICIVGPSAVYLLRREQIGRLADRENQVRCHAFQQALADQTNRAFVEVVGVLTRAIVVLERVESHLERLEMQLSRNAPPITA